MSDPERSAKQMKISALILRLFRIVLLSVVGVTQFMFLIFGSLYFFELLSSSGIVTASHRFWFLLSVPALLFFDICFLVRMADIIRKRHENHRAEPAATDNAV